MTKSGSTPSASHPTFTLNHWGIHNVTRAPDGQPRLSSWEGDAQPSPIGLDLLSKEVESLRVRRPAFREGWLRGGAGAARDRRGSDRFVEVPWDEAFDLVGAELERVRNEHGNDAIFGGSYGWGSAGRFHHAQSQIHKFLNTIGGYVKGRDSYSFGAGSVIMPHVVAPMEELLDQHTDWTTLAQNTELFVAFGGIPLRNTQVSAGGASSHRVGQALEQMRARGVRFVNISPRKSDIDGLCEWIPIRPGTDVALMLALIHELLVNNLHDTEFLSQFCTGAVDVAAYVLGEKDGVAKTPAWADEITTVPAERIGKLAKEMARSKTMINASWSLQRQSHGEQVYWALVTLAAHLGQIGQPGGGFGIGYGTLNSIGSSELRISGPRLPQGKNLVDAFIPVARIADTLLYPGSEYEYDGQTFTYPDIRLIYWAGGNPFHHHQDLNRFMSAWQRPETIIIHEQYWTGTAKAADIVLPVSTTFERNDIGFSSREGHLVAMQKSAEPLDEARSDFDIFAGIAERLGVKEDYTQGRSSEDWLEHMYEEFRERISPTASLPDFATFWQQGRLTLPAAKKPVILLKSYRDAPEENPLKTPSKKIELFSAVIESYGYDDCPGQATWIEPVEWLGSPKAAEYPIHLLSQEPKFRLHSQLDHAPLSRAAKIQGREPIVLNVNDARARNIKEGDVVRVYNARGACLAGVQISEDVIDGVAIIATGAWFDPQEWTPDNPLEKHGNPNAVTLDAGASRLSQATVAQSCLVQIERFDGELPKITAFDPPEFVTPPE